MAGVTSVALLVLLALIVALVVVRVRAVAVKCGCCGHRQRLRVSRKATFTCKRCKKTLPRRLAEPIVR